MLRSLNQVMDALDIETFFVCQSEQEGRNLMLSLLKNIGFKDIDIVFAEYAGPGARIRGRAYVHRPADKYKWLSTDAVKEGE